jgi:hypothetical protein
VLLLPYNIINLTTSFFCFFNFRRVERRWWISGRGRRREKREVCDMWVLFFFSLK